MNPIDLTIQIFHQGAWHDAAELGKLARQLSGLKQRLQGRGVPDSIIRMPVMGFDYLDGKLNSWKLP